ncbi:recombinase family protein [Xylella fastidiosa]|uniref:recombinase family protein n=1 Tax=Xylella fastidiosa TaxID=2371 RepID=UPI000AA6BE3F|nr:recombinase family protein [Xylella fastidiosa]
MFFVGFKDRLSGVAQFERGEMMLERQREGVVARAKAAGKYKGRKPISAAQRAKVLSL